MTLSPVSRRNRAEGERGSVSVLALIVAITVGGLSLAMLQEGLAAKGTLGRVEADVRSLELAETGLSRAERELTELIDTTGDGIGAVSGTFAGGSFGVTATQDVVRPERWTLLSTGRHGRSTRQVEVLVRRVESALYRYGLLSDDDLVFNGLNTTDQYDSRLGTYASQAVNADDGGTFAQEGGSVGSNSGVVELNGSSVYIRGDAIPGPLHSVEESGNPTVLGDTTPRRYEQELPPPPYDDFRAAYLSNDNLLGITTSLGAVLSYDPLTMELSVKGGKATFTGGTYFFSSITLRSQATLEVSGASKVYVTGNVDLTGGVLSNSGAPADFQVFAHPYDLPPGSSPTDTQVKINGGSGASWAFYGPAVDLKIGGGSDLFGAAVAKSITISGNCAFHYDKALGEIGGYGETTIERIAWRELTSPRR
jgi:hypothetical protein